MWAWHEAENIVAFDPSPHSPTDMYDLGCTNELSNVDYIGGSVIDRNGSLL